MATHHQPEANIMNCTKYNTQHTSSTLYTAEHHGRKCIRGWNTQEWNNKSGEAKKYTTRGARQTTTRRDYIVGIVHKNVRPLSVEQNEHHERNRPDENKRSPTTIWVSARIHTRSPVVILKTLATPMNGKTQTHKRKWERAHHTDTGQKKGKNY